MATSSRGPPAASFLTQANALLRKNLTFQKRNLKTNIVILSFPILFCVLIVVIQIIVNHAVKSTDHNQCVCKCVDTNGDGKCETVCSTDDLMGSFTCPVPSPPRWPPLLQVPLPEYRSVRADFIPFTDLPNDLCRKTQTCPATLLFTGGDPSFAKNLAQFFFVSSLYSNVSDYVDGLPNFVMGTDSDTGSTQFIEPAFSSLRPLYVLQPKCLPNSTLPLQIASKTLQKEVKCVEGLSLWRDSASLINDELYKGYQLGNVKKDTNEIAAAYDFLTSNENHFMVNIWYNASYKEGISGGFKLVRVPRSLNVASNAYLHLLGGSGTEMQFEYVKEMPKQATQIVVDVSSLIGGIFFVWIIELLFPVILTYLVYEKQHKLKIMMKMHGLGDGPYWMISYAYFLLISLLYMLCFVIFGSIIGLKFFTLNDYSIQFVFYFIYVNLQIALSFFLAIYFSDVKTATVIGYIYVFASGILGATLFQFFLEDTSFSRVWILVMEIFPGFSLFRGVYEFSQYSLSANYVGTSGMQWKDLDDNNNGMRAIMILMSIEWLVLLLLAYYLDQVGSSKGGIRKNILFFGSCLRKKPSLSSGKPSIRRQESNVSIEMEKHDVVHEREAVEKLLLDPSSNYAVICSNLKKVYPRRDGNPEKFAVKGLSLALPRGECFGMLGPNGAGKTSWISMMIGLTTPTSGTAYVQGMDIRDNMDKIYTEMGVCPQHDLLWETLTGREHLMFYGRLKNLKGVALTQAVEESLKSLNLFYGGVADKLAGKYSGGMKRRLSVAISLIGDPKVVYMDEPSTGLDPESRNHLWNVVKRAKEDRAIVLTTHSMEEAEYLCDRLGVFVDGSLQCVGNPKEIAGSILKLQALDNKPNISRYMLKARYGGTYVLTMTTSNDNEVDVEHLVRRLSPNATKIYHLSGTQKFEIPKNDVTIAEAFQAVENAKSRFPIQAWGLADTTLEDVFIKVARVAEAFNEMA